MIDKIFDISLRQRVFVILMVTTLIGVGLWSAVRLPIDAVPDITNVQVQLNTEVPALAPEEIEKQVTFPIETEMAGIQGMIEMRSLSKFGLSQVTLVFEDGTDVYRSRQLVSERIQNALESLPSGVQPKLAPISTGLGEIYYYIIDYKSDAKNKPATRYEQLLELKQIQDWIIKPILRNVQGIAEVNSSGGYEKQIVVFPNPDKMMSVGLAFDELAGVVSENVENAGGGVVQRAGEQIIIRAAGRVQNTDEIGNLPVKYRSGLVPLLVKDVAEVGIGSSIRTGASTANGQEALLGAALMLSGENSRIISQRVHAKLEEVQKKLPDGIEILPVYNRSELVNRTIGTVEKNLFEGAILVVIVLLALLGNWRAALVVASAIPLSMLFAVIGMVQTRTSGNLMSLGAIDFGLIVDGAVVMVENIIRRMGLRQNHLGRILTKEERIHTILSACKEVGKPTVFGVAIITLVNVPILALTGIEGKMFKPMALTVILALIGSLILAVTAIPVFCSFFLKGKIAEHDNKAVRWLKSIYEPMLDWVLVNRLKTVATSLALLVGAVFVFGRLGAEFVPQLDEGSFTVQMIRTTSIGLDASIEMQEQAEKLLLKKFPEVSHIFSRIGTPEVATDPMGVNVSDTYVFFTPKSKWRKIDGHTLNKETLADLMSKELSKAVPGQANLFSQPIEMRFNELLEGTRADIAVKIFGDDYEVLEKVAGQVREILEKIPGAADVEFDALGKAPMLEVTLDRSAMTQYNLHAEELNKVISSALGGEEVGKIIEGNRRFDIVVRMAENARQDLEKLRHLPLRTSDGGLIALGKVAKFTMVESVNAISRESGQRRVAIMINLRGRDVESFVNEAQEKIHQQVKLPEGYYVEFGGQFKNLQEARARLMVVVPVTLALIFVLIFLAFGSIRQALIVYSGIPLAATGGVFALLLCGLSFSISAGVGFIALSGVAVLDGVVLISYFNQLREEGKNIAESVREGSMTRLRPILMTALVASLGFVPMAIATGAGAEVQRPLAIVVIGGLLTSTFLKLLLFPVLYAWVETETVKQEHA